MYYIVSAIISLIGLIIFTIDGSYIMSFFLLTSSILSILLLIKSRQIDKLKVQKNKQNKIIEKTEKDNDKISDTNITNTNINEKPKEIVIDEVETTEPKVFSNTNNNDSIKTLENQDNTTIDIKVSGVTYNNPDGINRQKLIKEYVDDVSIAEPYGGYTNKEIKEHGFSDIWEYEVFEFNDIELIKEPDNQYDKNAIKVILKDYGLVGYVPKKDNIKIGKLLETSSKYTTSLEVTGGKLKYILIQLELKL